MHDGVAVDVFSIEVEDDPRHFVGNTGDRLF
jgi:hypothetical protein